MKLLRFIKFLLSASCCVGPVVAGCSTVSDACKVPDGEYHTELADDQSGDPPVVIFLHGYGGSGGAIVRNAALRKNITDRGYALIAPEGLRRGGDGPKSWNFHPLRTRGRDEAAFLKQVLDDAKRRFQIDPDNVLLAGFSIGGSMTTYLACNSPSDYSAFAPVGGSFWRPHPTSCKQPVRLFHTHGWTDGTVPLEGRKITEEFVQGDVFYAMDLFRQTNSCAQPRAREFDVSDAFWRRKWTECTSGSALELVLFPGGHKVPQGWTTMALDWFEALPPKP